MASTTTAEPNEINKVPSMKLLRLALPIVLVLVGLTPAWAQPELKPILEAASKEHAQAGMGAVLIIDGQIGEPQTVGTIGKGLDTPVPTDARWHLGSCSKSLTAMLAAVMVERGKLRWDMPVSEALAGRDVEIHPGFQEATIEQLLGHRAGLATKMVGRPIWRKLRRDGLTPVQQRHLITQTYLGEEPTTEPGTAFSYSNVGYVIVGHIIELMEDKPYEELMPELIFEPLGLTSAGFGPPQGDDQPRGHNANVPMPPTHPSADNPEGLAPAGRIHMSLGDWARYAQIHLRAARGESFELLTAASYKRLHTPLEGQSYALGWGRPEREWTHGLALSHAGSNTMWRAVIWIAPGRNAALLVTTTHGGLASKAACQDVLKAAIGRL